MSLSFKRSGHLLWNDVVAAGTGAAVPIDNGFNNTYQALYSVSLESGDWVTIQGTLDKDNWYTQAIVSTAGGSLVPIDGPFRQLRVIKTGSAGKARVYLYG